VTTWTLPLHPLTVSAAGLAGLEPRFSAPVVPVLLQWAADNHDLQQHIAV